MQEIGSVGKVALGTYVGNAAMKATEAVAGLAKSAIEVGSNFETAMSQVAATMGITTDEIAAGNKDFEMLSAKAKEMGASTKFTATEAAEGLNILAMAGLSAADACAGIDTVLSLAAAGAMSLDQAATYVTGSVKAFSDSMENADYYADLMAKGATLANTDVASLGDAMVKVGATAASYGQEADGLTLSLLRLAEQNVTGSEAATAMNRAMMDLYTPTSSAKTQLEELGVAVYDDAGNAREFNTVVDELNAALAGMSQEEANAAKNTIFTTFGLQAFNKMTVASTETVEKFKDGLAEASGSAMQQMATQTDNLQGKLAIFNSACEAVGVSVYEIFEDMMKDGVDDAAEAMTRLNKSVKSGDLGKSLARLAESIGELAENTVDFAEDALPVAIDGLTWILDNSELIISGITGIASANLYMGTVAPIIEGLVASWNAYKTANEGATVAQWALNAAQAANPAGAIATALVALIAALGTYIILTDDEYEAYTKLNKESSEMIKSNQELRKSLQETAEERKQNRAELESEGAAANKLVGELKELTSKTTLTEKEQRRLKEVVGQLNAIMPELNLSIDEQTGALNMSTDAIEDNIDALMRQAKVEAARADMEAIASEQYEAEKQLNELYKQRADALAEVNQAEEEYKAALQDENAILDSNGLVIDQAIEKRDQAKQAAANLNEEIRNSEIAVGELSEEYAAAAEYAQANTDATNDLAAAQENAAAATEGAADSTNEMSEAIAEWQGNLDEAITKAISLFDEFTAKTDTSKDQILKNMQSQIDGMKSWSEDLNTLAERGIDQGLLQHLADMGPSGAGYVSEFTKMTGEELDKAGELFRQSVVLPETTAAEIVESYTKAGEGATQAYIDGQWVKINDGSVKQASEQIVKDSIDAIDTTLGGKGADSEVGKRGQQIPEDTVAGIDKTKEELTTTVEGLTTEIVETFEENLSPAKFQTIGEGIIEGILSGIRNKKGELQSEIDELEDLENQKKEKSESGSGGGGKAGSGGGGQSSGSQSYSSSSMAYSSGSVAYNSGSFSDGVMATYETMQASVAAAAAVVPVEVNTSVYLEGDADGVFRLVRQETDRTVRTTGNNPLMKGEYKG